MRACVIFDSRFGNTEKVARSLQAGIREAGVETVCVNSRDVKLGSLKEYDLVCIGAPTEAFTASKPIKDFIAGLGEAELSGKYCFAFDTKLDWRVSGSASKFIEKKPEQLGLRVLARRESAIVRGSEGKDRVSTTTLKEGEEKRFQQIGREVGAAVLAGTKPVAA